MSNGTELEDIFNLSVFKDDSTTRPTTGRKRGSVSGKRARQQQLMRNKHVSERDVGPHPHVSPEMLELKEACNYDFRRFLVEVFPEQFFKDFSPDHEDFIQSVQDAILNGGNEAFALPRSSGKTTIIRCGAIWAISYRHRRYCAIISSKEQLAIKILRGIKTAMDTPGNKYSLMFPEISHYAIAINGTAQRASGQLCNGVRTGIKWGTKEVITAGIETNPEYLELCNYGVFEVAGIDGNIRGLQQALPNGETIRPDLILIDDPQDRKKARNSRLVQNTVELIDADILGLGGLEQSPAAFMSCTLIEPGDVAAVYIRRWHSICVKCIKKMPDALDTEWMKYIEFRRNLKEVDNLPDEQVDAKCNAYYLERRAEMDAGAVVYWESRYDEKKEVSALQAAFNFWADKGEKAFYSEMQNDPQIDDVALDIISVENLMKKTNGYAKAEIPNAAQWVTLGTDVHDNILYYMIVAWSDDSTGWIIENDTFPRQPTAHFRQASAKVSLQNMYDGGKKANIRAALLEHMKTQLGRDFKRAGAAHGRLQIQKALTDSGYEKHQVQAVKRLLQTAVMELSRGIGITAGRKPMSEYDKKPGEIHGHNWYFPTVRRNNEYPYLGFDSNYWKTVVIDGLSSPAGDPGSITLYGNNRTNHKLLAEHLVDSESYTTTEGHGRKVKEWKPKLSNPENHWLDCLVMCAVAASNLGMNIPGQSEAGPTRRPRRTVVIPEHLKPR
jgi:hypothetical protein